MNPAPHSARLSAGRLGLLLAAAAVPVSLLWDYAWETTVGIDRVWAPPHAATYAAMLLAAGAALGLLGRAEGVRVGKWRAPLGAWVALWGAGAFVAAFFFDRWWQAGYGLAAGLWHPPQLLKAAAFFAVLAGAWLAAAGAQERRGGALAFAVAGGWLLALLGVVTLAGNFANRQHAATFYQVACGTYPIVLAACARAGRLRWPATTAALAATLLGGAMVWLLPLIPGTPLVAPIYNARDHLLAPPFPLLLVAPALALDALLRVFPGRAGRSAEWSRAVEGGLAFFVVFLAVQWPFAQFLLSPAAEHWCFAGGGKEWPFFLKIDPSARAAFWPAPGDELTLANALRAAGLAVLATRLGLWMGAWMQRLRR